MKPRPIDLGFIALVALYVLICWVLTLAAGLSDRFMPMMYLGLGLQTTLVLGLGYIIYRLARAGWIMLRVRPPRLSYYLLEDLKKGPLRAELWARALPVFVAFFFFFSTFTSMKFLIADIRPFAWDEFFMNADRTVHFGIDPWSLLQPLLGRPLLTKIISFVYILWLPMFFAVLYWQLFRIKDDALRMRFFYTFVLSWAINGTFLAILFSSAGPCYFQNVTGSDHYAPLMDYLRSANEQYKIYSVWTQDLLWRNYMDKGVVIGGGISAFPSVHVGTAFLFVLLARHVNCAAFAFFAAFFVFIFLGSIHLGWHYAVDGYFSMLLTWGIWSILPLSQRERAGFLRRTA